MLFYTESSKTKHNHICYTVSVIVTQSTILYSRLNEHTRDKIINIFYTTRREVSGSGDHSLGCAVLRDILKLLYFNRRKSRLEF